MASTYSDLKIQLMTTGENTGTWGSVTNVNLGTAIEEAIVGSATVAFNSADVTLTLTNSNASQTARNIRLVLTGTSGGARQLVVPAIEKTYIIKNELADQCTVKVSGQTGVVVPAGKTMWVYNDSTDVVDVTTYLSSLAVGSAIGVTSGGTGTNTITANAVVVGNGTSAVQVVAPGTSGNVLTSNGTNWSSAALPPADNASNLTTGVTAVNVGGTGATTLNTNNVILGNGTSAVQFVAPGTSGNVLTSNGTTWASAALTVGLNGQVFTNTGTFTIPAGVTKLKMTIVGAGGAGGGASNGGGGGAGGAAIKWLSGLTPGNTLAVTVGSANGGTSSVASGTQSITTVSATGGTNGNSSGGAGAGGVGSNGDLNITGGSGNTAYGNSIAGVGGSSILGGGGTDGQNGGSYGGGGGRNGSGAKGVVVFEW